MRETDSFLVAIVGKADHEPHQPVAAAFTEFLMDKLMIATTGWRQRSTGHRVVSVQLTTILRLLIRTFG